MKYFTEEITTLLDGTVAKALTDKATEEDSISSALSAYVSAIINPNVESIHVEAKDNFGNVYENK